MTLPKGHWLLAAALAAALPAPAAAGDDPPKEANAAGEASAADRVNAASAPNAASPTSAAGTANAAKAEPSGPQNAGTLEAIPIEGEIDVPQVLFITASERPRFHDRRYRDYLPGRLEAVRKTVLPSRLSVHFRP